MSEMLLRHGKSHLEIWKKYFNNDALPVVEAGLYSTFSTQLELNVDFPYTIGI